MSDNSKVINEFLKGKSKKFLKEIIFKKKFEGSIDFGVLELNGFNDITKIVIPEGDVNEIVNLPIKLQFLNCSKNKISILPKLPETLEVLNISDNKITIIDLEGVQNLKELNVSQNKITIIKNVPESIEIININDNNVIEFDFLGLFNLKHFEALKNIGIKLLNVPNNIDMKIDPIYEDKSNVEEIQNKNRENEKEIGEIGLDNEEEIEEIGLDNEEEIDEIGLDNEEEIHDIDDENLDDIDDESLDNIDDESLDDIIDENLDDVVGDIDREIKRNSLVLKYYSLKNEYEKKKLEIKRLIGKEPRKNTNDLCVKCKKVGGSIFTSDKDEHGKKRLFAYCGSSEKCFSIKVVAGVNETDTYVIADKSRIDTINLFDKKGENLEIIAGNLKYEIISQKVQDEIKDRLMKEITELKDGQMVETEKNYAKVFLNNKDIINQKLQMINELELNMLESNATNSTNENVSMQITMNDLYKNLRTEYKYHRVIMIESLKGDVIGSRLLLDGNHMYNNYSFTDT
jgi:hypothetical protein